MQIFKRWGVIVIIVIIVNCIMKLCFTPPSYMRQVMHEVQDKKSNYNMVIVGQSHGSFAYNPEIIDEFASTQSYNLCKALITMRDIPYIVKEVNYSNNLDYVIYDIDYTYWTGAEVPNYYADGYIYPYLRNPRNKLDYFIRYNLSEDYRYTLCRYIIYGKDDLKRVPERIKIKLSKEYRDYDVLSALSETEKKNYDNNGFRYATEHYSTEYKGSSWNENYVKKDAYEGFVELAKYCQSERIKLICVNSPLPASRLENCNYNECSKYFEKLSHAYGAEYIDFNRIDIGYEWSEDDFQEEEGHMMGEAAGVLSEYIGEYVRDIDVNGKENETN